MSVETIDESIEEIIERLRHKQGPLLPILHAIQANKGFIPSDAVGVIANKLNLSRAEVHGVVSFYHDFKAAPTGLNTVQICRAEACQAMGSEQLEEHAKASLNLDWGETSADGAITLEPVYCLGNCACSPSIRINNNVHARVDAKRFDVLMAELKNHQ